MSSTVLTRRTKDEHENNEESGEQQGRRVASASSEEHEKRGANTQVESTDQDPMDSFEPPPSPPTEQQSNLGKDGMDYQPFSKENSPYLIGDHGLYVFGQSKEGLAPLLPAVECVEYGKTRAFEIPPERFSAPVDKHRELRGYARSALTFDPVQDTPALWAADPRTGKGR